MDKKEFRKLQEHWYGILAKTTDFVDIETIDDMEKGYCPKQHGPALDLEKDAYFEQCEAFANLGTLKDQLDMFILDKHCEGVSNRDISKLLGSHGFKALTSRAIDLRLRKILTKAGIDPITFNQ